MHGIFQTQHLAMLRVSVRRMLWIGVDPPETRYALSDVDHLQFQDFSCNNACTPACIFYRLLCNRMLSAIFLLRDPLDPPDIGKELANLLNYVFTILPGHELTISRTLRNIRDTTNIIMLRII